MHKVFGFTSVDANKYYTIAKQKDDTRVVKWSYVSPSAREHPEYSKQKSIVSGYHTLITKGLRIGNYPQSKGGVYYKKVNDSLDINSYFIHAPFAGDFSIQYKGNDIMDRNGFGKIKIHKSDSSSLNDIKFIEKLYDGTIRTFYPHEIKESKSKYF